MKIKHFSIIHFIKISNIFTNLFVTCDNIIKTFLNKNGANEKIIYTEKGFIFLDFSFYAFFLSRYPREHST